MKRWHFWMGAGVCFALAAVLAGGAAGGAAPGGRGGRPARPTTLAENFQARLVQCSIVLLFHSHVVLLFRFAVIALSHSYATT